MLHTNSYFKHDRVNVCMNFHFSFLLLVGINVKHRFFYKLGINPNSSANRETDVEISSFFRVHGGTGQ